MQLNMQAFVAHSQAPNDLSWYTNTGSTNHLTNDFQNLNLSMEPFQGIDTIQVGDGTSLPIRHIGSSNLSLPNSTFKLHLVLHVAQIKKNLISVSQFTADNNVFIEFHVGYFFCEGRVHVEPTIQRQN